MTTNPFAPYKPDPQARGQNLDAFRAAVRDTYFGDEGLAEDDKWNEESANVMMLFDLSEFKKELPDLRKAAMLREAPRTRAAYILLRILWRMTCTEPELEELRDLNNEVVRKYLAPGAKRIECIMQGGKTLKGMLLHSCWSAGLQHKPVLLFGHSGATHVHRDLTSQVGWLQSIYKSRVYEPAKAAWERGAAAMTKPSERWLPDKLVISSWRLGLAQDTSTVGKALKELEDPRTGEVQVWFNIWPGSGDTPSAALKHMDDLRLGEDHMYAVVDEAHLRGGANKYHDDLRQTEDRFRKFMVEITATPYALEAERLMKAAQNSPLNNNDDDFDELEQKQEQKQEQQEQPAVSVVQLRPSTNGYYCLRTCHTTAAIKEYETAGVYDVKYEELEAPGKLRRPVLATECKVLLELFVPAKNREALRREIEKGEIQGEIEEEETQVEMEEEKEKSLSEPVRQRARYALATLEAISKHSKPKTCELPGLTGQTKALQPLSLLVHNGFPCGRDEGPEMAGSQQTQNCAHAQLSKLFVAEGAHQLDLLTQDNTLDETFREEHSRAFILGFPDYMTSTVVRPAVDVVPGVHCNQAVVEFIKEKDNRGALLDAFHELCKSKSDSTVSARRVQVLSDKKYEQYEEFFSKFKTGPLEVVDANSDGATWETLLAKYSAPYARVYRVAFPKGFSLQVRKEMMYLLYCKSVNVYKELPFAVFQPADTDLVKAVNRMRWRPLREMTVGRQLLRHSVAVTSLRSSLQPTHCIFAWNCAASANLDDVHQGVGRINGKRTHTLHHEACYPGKTEMAERRPVLEVAKPFYNMIAKFADTMEDFKHAAPTVTNAYNYAVMLGFASAAKADEADGATTGQQYGTDNTKGKLHMSGIMNVRQLDGALHAGGIARATHLLDGPMSIQDFLMPDEADEDVPDESSDDGSGGDDDDDYDLLDESSEDESSDDDDKSQYDTGDKITGSNFKSWMTSVLPTDIAKNTKNETSIRAAVRWARDKDLQLHTRADVAVALYGLDTAEAGRDSPNPLSGWLCSREQPQPPHEPTHFGASSLPVSSVALWALKQWLKAERRGQEDAITHAMEDEVLNVASWTLFDSPPDPSEHAEEWRDFLGFWRERIGFADQVPGACCVTGCRNEAGGKRFCIDHQHRCNFKFKRVCGKEVSKEVSKAGAKYCDQHNCSVQGCLRQRWTAKATQCKICNSKLKCSSHECSETRCKLGSSHCPTCKRKRSPNRKGSGSSADDGVPYKKRRLGSVP
jgi:hypothetical protein